MPEGMGEVCRVGGAIAVAVGVTVASVVLGVLGQATLAIELYHNYGGIIMLSSTHKVLQ